MKFPGSSNSSPTSLHGHRHRARIYSSFIREQNPNRKNPLKKQNKKLKKKKKAMSYDDVEIEDMEWNEELQAYTYPCPCGDLFQITKDELRIGEEIARCPSCSLYITVIYNIEDFLDNKSKEKLEPSKQQPVAVA